MIRFVLRVVLVVVLAGVSGGARAAGLQDEIIYFVMLDRFADGDPANNMDVERANPLAFQGGDLKGLRENLDEIASLGATMIWITPVAQQIGEPQDHQGTDFFPHHGYWAADLKRVDPRFGSEADLKALVDAAHERGLKIILDVVYNHLGYGMETNPEFSPWLRSGRTCGGSDPLTMCLSGLPDLKTELDEVRDYLFEANIGLAERTGLDGFRLDTVKHVSHAFWQAHRDEVDRRLGEDFVLIGEVWDADRFLARDYFRNDEMDALFDFSFRDRVLKLVNGIYDAQRFGRYLAKRHDVRSGYFMAPFLSNHDMPMALAMMGGDEEALAMAVTILMSVQGPPVIVYGEEVGRKGGVWPDNRGVMPWGDGDVFPGAGLARNERLRKLFVDLIALRKAHEGLRGGEFEVEFSSSDVLVYSRGDDVLVALNRSLDPFPLVLDEVVGRGDWRLVFSSDGGAGGETGVLPPRSALIYVEGQAVPAN